MMKTIPSFLLPALLLPCVAVSCFGIADESFPELSPITVTALSDTINVQRGEVLHYTGLTVVSDRPVTYEWAYGSAKSGTTVEQHLFETRTVLETTSPTLDVAFDRLGSYILRLRLDNGESIAYKYFRLNVNFGLDEGAAVLTNRPDGSATLAFLKTLTAEERERGDEALVLYTPVDGLRQGAGLYMTAYPLSGALGYQAGLAIATHDEDGTIYLLEPKTMELVDKARMSDYGTRFKEFGGEYARVHDIGVFFLSEDDRVFRFDYLLGYLTEMTDFPEGLTRAFPALYRSGSTAETWIRPFFFGPDLMCTRTTVSSGIKVFRQEGFEFVNIACPRTSTDAYCIYALLRSRTDPHAYRIQRGYRESGGSMVWKTETGEDGGEVLYHYDFTSSDLRMDASSKFVSTRSSSDVYYSYGNAVYRWGLAAAPATRPAITLPAGEQIRDIATNFMGKEASVQEGEDLLYIATYNASRPAETSGRLYVYRFSDDTEVEHHDFPGDPVGVIYKYRIN